MNIYVCYVCLYYKCLCMFISCHIASWILPLSKLLIDILLYIFPIDYIACQINEAIIIIIVIIDVYLLIYTFIHSFIYSFILSPVCGGHLTNPYGDIKSPGYPGNYPPNRDCYWTIDVGPALIITFAFGTLSLEHHPDCNYDYLEVGRQLTFRCTASTPFFVFKA